VFALLAPALARRAGATRGGINAARWLVCASYPLLSVDRHVTDQVVLFFHLDAPSSGRIWPFLLITRTPLLGMICLWLACLLCLRSLAASGDAENDDPALVVHGEE
jgi:hypothetical protein